jgi:hypothetical protein
VSWRVGEDGHAEVDELGASIGWGAFEAGELGHRGVVADLESFDFTEPAAVGPGQVILEDGEVRLRGGQGLVAQDAGGDVDGEFAGGDRIAVDQTSIVRTLREKYRASSWTRTHETPPPGRTGAEASWCTHPSA